jgi:hypothetical protein
MGLYSLVADLGQWFFNPALWTRRGAHYRGLARCVKHYIRLFSAQRNTAEFALADLRYKDAAALQL